MQEASNTTIASWPSGSKRRGCGDRESGTNSPAAVRATTPIGRLIQKIARQSTNSTRMPPTSGPSPMPIPETPPQMPMARARSRGSVKTLVMIDMATGLSIEPPSACTIRKATSHPTDGPRLHSTDPQTKIARPVWNVRRRPTRSAIEPDSNKKLASTTTYASMVHCNPEIGAPRSLLIDGNATLMIVVSMLTMNRLIQQIPSTSNFRRLLRHMTAMVVAMG
jgi:hypothetical protein